MEQTELIKESELNQKIQPLLRWPFCEPNPIPLNTLLAMTGNIRPIFRLPYVPLNAQKRSEGKHLLMALSQGDWIGDELTELSDDAFMILPQ